MGQPMEEVNDNGRQLFWCGFALFLIGIYLSTIEASLGILGLIGGSIMGVSKITSIPNCDTEQKGAKSKRNLVLFSGFSLIGMIGSYLFILRFI
ncbi:hypothetical protein [Alteribacter populi]|uniref:hypothetical protein n=1 Tax=Alteribacter populi TaxID=2011011 RepID=UPI000BBAA09A|nr:hypothetical protein [Alteribacter populi]